MRADQIKKKSLRLNKEQLDKIKKQAVREASERVFIQMIFFPLGVLASDFSFSREQLEKFTEEVMSAYDSFDHNVFELDDMVKVVEEMTGYRIERTIK